MEQKIKKTIAVFSGSKEGIGTYSALAEDLGAALAKNGFAVVNGGGPGLMDLVAKGAYVNGGEVVGVNFEWEGREVSAYNTKTFAYTDLYPRQQKIIELANAFVVLPGGIGTVFELFEVLAKKHLSEIDSNTPVILLPGDYWESISVFAKKQVDEGFMSERYLEQFMVCDSVEDVILELEKRIHEKTN